MARHRAHIELLLFRKLKPINAWRWIEDSAVKIESFDLFGISYISALGTRYELLDLLDYAKQHNSDSIPVEHILEELQGLEKIDEECISKTQIDYVKSHQSPVLHSIRENPPRSGLYLVCGDWARYPFFPLAYFNSDASVWVRINGIKYIDSLKECKISHCM